MRRKFATNLIFLIAANLLVKPYWIFGIERVVQNRLGAETYGTYFAVFNYSFLFSILLDFGINNFNNRAVSRNNSRLSGYLPNLMLIKFFLSIIYLAFTFLSAMVTGFSEQQLYMLFFLALNQVLLSAILYFRSNLAALQLFKTDSFISILDRLLTIVFCLVLLYGATYSSNFNIMWFIYAQTAAVFITALVAFFIVISKTPLRIKLWKLNFSKKILLKSMPFAVLALLMGIYYRIDGVMIERMLPNGAHEAGIYAASFRLLDAANMFGYLFATLLLPMFAAMIRNKENLQPLVRFSSGLMFAGSVALAVNCFFFRDEIMRMLYPAATEYWSWIFGLLIINFVPMSSVYVFGTLLTAKGSLKWLNWIAAGGVVLNIGLNLVLIPAYGALGAAVATLITQVIAALAHIAVANGQFNFGYALSHIARVIIYTACCTGVVFMLTLTPFHWVINLVTGGVVCLLLVFVFKVVPLPNTWTGFIKKIAS